ncbi:Uncharacterised protein [Neisseria zoodegmatis]|uniref:Uncharacterized protein n=1 Tax=Neisseria zoodegmatis TaxID=326523 RepID=A0A378WGL9_9NEIS|nr:hypothetical protein [Neisseria zoodegmatis]SUA35694.1 Uncharacterised protein [Neisseria zoodegmatis]
MEKSLNSYHDKEIVGYYFDKVKKILHIYIEEDKKIIFKNIIFFEFTEISMQNVIFELRSFNSKTMSDELLEIFPTLAFYKAIQKTYQCFHVYPSVGLEGIIICEE